MPLTVSLTDAEVSAIIKDEAKAAILRLACGVVMARKAKGMADESRAVTAVRQQARAMVESRITRAVSEEESRSAKVIAILGKARPDQLDGLGAQLKIDRTTDETDEDYLARMLAATDLEIQPWRSLLGDAMEAALDAVVAATGTPLVTIAARIATDLADPASVKRGEALGR